jgi:hemin uptake protein HemP
VNESEDTTERETASPTGRATASNGTGRLKTPAGQTTVMGETRVVEAGEYGPEELLTALEGGDRIVVRTEFLGTEHEVTLRHDGEVYYCDTPTRLHKHDTAEEMRTCLENQGYASADGDG